MPPTLSPPRQQAHELVDRLSPLQISALIDLFEPLAQAESASQLRGPLFGELPIDIDYVPPRMRRPGLRAPEA